MVSNSWREVTHFWYLGWPEKGVPLEANSLIAFLIEARSYVKNPIGENVAKVLLSLNLFFFRFSIKIIIHSRVNPIVEMAKVRN